MRRTRITPHRPQSIRWRRGVEAHPLVIRSRGLPRARSLFIGERFDSGHMYEIGEDRIFIVFARDRLEYGWLAVQGPKRRRLPSPITVKDTNVFKVIGEFEAYISTMIFLRDLERRTRGLKPKTPEWIDPVDSIRIEKIERRLHLPRVES